MTSADIPGWYDWEAGTREAVGRFGDGDTFVEVGCYLGRSLCRAAEVIRESGKRIRLVGVDWCRGTGGPVNHYRGDVDRGGGSFASELAANVWRCGADAILVVADSVAAAGLFAGGSVAWVNIDADHEYEAVKRDIAAWLPKVMPGGWLTGHDFRGPAWPGVARAVSELLPGAEPWATDSWRWKVPAGN